MRALRFSVFVLVPVLLLVVGAGSACWAQDSEFEPIPEAQKALYRFNFKQWFYEDDAARQEDRERIPLLIAELQALEPKMGEEPEALLNAIVLREQIKTLADKVQSYGGLRSATDTADETFQAEAREGEETASEAEAGTDVVVSAIIALPQEKLDSFLANEPGLKKYEYFLLKSRASADHRASDDVEVALAQLEEGLDPFQRPFRNLMIARSPDAAIMVGESELRVTNRNDYATLLRNADRAIRQKAFEARIATYRAQGDVFAYALFEKTRTANEVASMRGFADGADAAYDKLELEPELVDRVLEAFRDNSLLAIRFQKAEAEYQKRILGLESVAPWDIDASPEALEPPLHTIGEASESVSAATSAFGPEYGEELASLLDPTNGRLDIVPSQDRESGDFVWGFYGPSWLLYMQGYEGHTNQVVTLAHESAHAVHFRLLHKSGVPYDYSDGARYFVEGCAKINELLVLDKLAEQAKDDAERLFYKRQIASKLASVRFASMYWAAYATSFERDVVKGIAAGCIESPDDIHDVWGDYGRLWSIDFAENPDLKYTWPDTEHFLADPRRYAQYLFAWVVALSVYEKMQSDPLAGERFVALMERGFSDRVDVLLKEEMGIVLDDPGLIQRMFDVVDARVTDFEQAVAAASK